MGIIQYIKEVLEIRKRQRNLRRIEKQAYKQIRKGNDDKLQEVATDIAPENEELVPKIVGAISDEVKQVETVGKVAEELSTNGVVEVVSQMEDKTIESKFNTEIIPKRNFQKVLLKLALAGASEKFVLALCQEKNPYNNLYKIIDIIESQKTNQNIELNHFQIIDIIKQLKKDDRIREEEQGTGKFKCVSLYMAYKIAKYGTVFPLQQFLDVLKEQGVTQIEDDKRMQIPQNIQIEYDKIMQKGKIAQKNIHKYNRKEYEEQIRKYIQEEQKIVRNKQLNGKGENNLREERKEEGSR